MPDLADDQVAIPNGETPQTHLVSHIDGVIPKAVTATFDGSGAAGKFLPTLIIAGKEGREVARIPAPEVAAGATAEVSWFPRGLKAAAAAAAGFTPAHAQVAAGGLGAIGPGTVVVTWPNLSTTDASVFELNPADHTKVTVKKPGVYLLSGEMLMVTQPTLFTKGAYMFADVRDASNTPVGTDFGSFWRFDDATAADPKEVAQMHGEDYSGMAAGYHFPISVRCFFQLGQAVNIGGAQMILTRLTPTAF